MKCLIALKQADELMDYVNDPALKDQVVAFLSAYSKLNKFPYGIPPGTV